MRAMHLIMQQENPGDYVIATGVTTTVRDFVKLSFAFIGAAVEFEGVKEVGKLTAVEMRSSRRR